MFRIDYIAPAERHIGEEGGVFGGRQQVYAVAKARNSRRYGREPRNWRPGAAVRFNW